MTQKPITREQQCLKWYAQLLFSWGSMFKARLHRRFLSQQLDAIFVAAKSHKDSNMFETPAIPRRQIAPGLHLRFWSCNFSATKIASSCCDKNRLCKRAFSSATSRVLPVMVKNAIDCIIFKLITYCLRQHFIAARWFDSCTRGLQESRRAFAVQDWRHVWDWHISF